MQRRTAVATVLAFVAAVPAVAVAAPPGATFPVNASYKGWTGQHLLSTAKVAGQRLTDVTLSVQRFCSDGSMSYGRIVDTNVADQGNSKLKPTGNGGFRFATTITAANGTTAQIKGKIRKGWMTGTITYPDLAALPAGLGFEGDNGTPPTAGATCSTTQDGTSSTETFKLHYG